jgi:hypothetical protein
MSRRRRIFEVPAGTLDGARLSHGRVLRDTSRVSGVTFRLEVATGGDPARVLVRAVLALPRRRGEVWTVAVRHDDGCPALDAGGPMAACTCELVELRARRAA